MKSIYKVGDEVLIKSKWDDNYNGYDYPFTFTEEMLHIHGGKICKIKEVFPSRYFKERKCYEESYGYFLDGSMFRWSSAMFEKEF